MMDSDLSTYWQMWPTLAIIAGAVVLYASERLPIELISLGAIVALIAVFQIWPIGSDEVLSPTVLLSGFSNPALITILALLVLGQGMYQSGALEGPTQRLMQTYKKHPKKTEGGLFAFAFIISAFMNNTPVVVMFIPIVAALAMQQGLGASRLMMPLSFICILGGMTTLIGTSTNLLVAGSYEELTGQEIRFFDFTAPALILAAAGMLYLMTIGSRLIPQRGPDPAANAQNGDGKQFIAQIAVTPGHPLIGKGPVAGHFPDLPDVTVRAVQRRERTFLPPFEELSFAPGDILIIAATRATLTKLLKSKPEFLAGMVFRDGQAPEEGAPSIPTGELKLVEAIVAPGSRMIGRTVEQIGFYYQTNCVLLGVQRRSRMIRVKMNDIRLEAGDVLLVMGARSDIRELRNSRDLLPIEWSMTDIPHSRAEITARIIFAAVVVAIAATGVDTVVPALIGAFAMVMAGCINIRQAIRAIDLKILFLIAAALAMGAALEETGGAGYLAQELVRTIEPYGVPALLSAFFILTAVTTNVLSNNATAVLFTPVAFSASQQMGIDPLPFVYSVIFGANCSFATPLAYQTNLLVMGPGHYKFRDFLIVGGPLVVILWIVYTLAAPIAYSAMGLL